MVSTYVVIVVTLMAVSVSFTVSVSMTVSAIVSVSVDGYYMSRPVMSGDVLR
jgi:hypothetical protein